MDKSITLALLKLRLAYDLEAEAIAELDNLGINTDEEINTLLLQLIESEGV